MPSRNIIKSQTPDAYYHVYARGGNKQKIFLEAADYKYFLSLFERYLSEKPAISKTGELYPHFFGHIELLTYCLMSNHFHLLVYQYELPYLEKFMRSLMTSYSRYFNLKYRRTGSLFESRYKATRVDRDAYLQHISRYIHLNPRLWKTYRHSSLRYFREGSEPVWLRTSKILEIFENRQSYTQFVADYKEQRDMLAELKYQLADL
jgi:REP-associated tyrosine transposase